MANRQYNKGDTIFWHSFDFGLPSDACLLQTKIPLVRLHSGTIVKWSYSNRTITVTTMANTKFIESAQKIGISIANLHRLKKPDLTKDKIKLGDISSYELEKVEITIPMKSIYTSVDSFKMDFIKFIVSDFSTDAFD